MLLLLLHPEISSSDACHPLPACLAYSSAARRELHDVASAFSQLGRGAQRAAATHQKSVCRCNCICYPRCPPMPWQAYVTEMMFMGILGRHSVTATALVGAPTGQVLPQHHLRAPMSISASWGCQELQEQGEAV